MFLVWWMCRECGLIVALNNHQNQLAMEQTHRKDSTSPRTVEMKNTATHNVCFDIGQHCIRWTSIVIYDYFLTSNNSQSKNCWINIEIWCKSKPNYCTLNDKFVYEVRQKSLFGFVFLLHDNRAAMSIEFMFVLLRHFVYIFRGAQKLLPIIIGLLSVERIYKIVYVLRDINFHVGGEMHVY